MRKDEFGMSNGENEKADGVGQMTDGKCQMTEEQCEVAGGGGWLRRVVGRSSRAEHGLRREDAGKSPERSQSWNQRKAIVHKGLNQKTPILMGPNEANPRRVDRSSTILVMSGLKCSCPRARATEGLQARPMPTAPKQIRINFSRTWTRVCMSCRWRRIDLRDKPVSSPANGDPGTWPTSRI